MDATQQCVSVCLYLIDGQRHQFLQTSAEGVPEMLEHLRRTKVFGQPNLLVQGDDALSTFPTHAVARLDLLTAAPIPPICPSTWTEAHELTAEEFLQRRLEVRRDSQGHPRERIRDQAHTLLVAYDLLGGYPVYLEAQVIRPDDVPRPNLTASDLGMARQHAPQHTIAFDRRDGGYAFLNSTNIVRTYRYPGGLSRSPNMLLFEGKELREPDLRTCLE